MDPKVGRKQGSDCSTAAAVFNHNSVLYVLAIISISLKLWMNNRQIPPSFWLSLGKKMSQCEKKTHFWGEWGREEQGGVQGRTWSGDGTRGEWCKGSHTHLVYSTVPLSWTIQTGSHQQTTYDFSMRAHSGHLSLVTSPMRVEHLLSLLEIRDTGSHCHHLPLQFLFTSFLKWIPFPTVKGQWEDHRCNQIMRLWGARKHVWCTVSMSWFLC